MIATATVHYNIYSECSLGEADALEIKKIKGLIFFLTEKNFQIIFVVFWFLAFCN